MLGTFHVSSHLILTVSWRARFFTIDKLTAQRVKFLGSRSHIDWVKGRTEIPIQISLTIISGYYYLKDGRGCIKNV